MAIAPAWLHPALVNAAIAPDAADPMTALRFSAMDDAAAVIPINAPVMLSPTPAPASDAVNDVFSLVPSVII